MTDLVRPEKSSGLFGHFFAARAAVQDAAQVIVANVQRPDAQKLLVLLQRYALAQGGPPHLHLERFMVQIREQLKKMEVTIDPLVMYTLQFNLANATNPNTPS